VARHGMVKIIRNMNINLRTRPGKVRHGAAWYGLAGLGLAWQGFIIFTQEVN